MIKYFIGLSLLAGLLLAACSKSSIVGSEILGDDYIDVNFTDTTSLKAMNIKADSVRVYPTSNSMFLLGNINDPVFGNTQTEIYTQLRKLFDPTNLENAVLDSVVLSLSINNTGLWGDTLADHTIEVYELGESLVDIDSIYSNRKFERGSLLGTRTYNPLLADTAAVIESLDTFYYNNICRIQLDQAYGEMLLADTLSLQNDTLIQELTNGLLIKSSSASNAVFGVNNSVFLDDYNNKLILYYTKDDTIHTKLPLTIGGKRGMYIDHDRTNALVNDYFANPEGSDSLIFISGLQNSNAILEIPFIEHFDDDVLINYAEVEFYVAELSESLPFSHIDQLYVFNQDEDGKLSYMEDLNISISENVITYYDGILQEEENDEGIIMKKYKINFTNEIKKRIREGDTSTKLLIVPAFSTIRAYRSVIYGPGHSTYPAKLKISYTQK